MTILWKAEYRLLCPLSKKYIKKNNIACLFNKRQYENFKKIIYNCLYLYLNNDIIDLIIEFTGYKKYINRFGHLIYAYWGNYDKKLKRQIKIVNYQNTDDTSSDTASDTASDNNLDESDN